VSEHLRRRPLLPNGGQASSLLPPHYDPPEIDHHILRRCSPVRTHSPPDSTKSSRLYPGIRCVYQTRKTLRSPKTPPRRQASPMSPSPDRPHQFDSMFSTYLPRLSTKSLATCASTDIDVGFKANHLESISVSLPTPTFESPRTLHSQPPLSPSEDRMSLEAQEHAAMQRISKLRLPPEHQ